MKRFHELSPSEQTLAIDKCGQLVLDYYSQVTLPEEDPMTSIVDRARDDMERMRTPWFFAERLMELAGDEIRQEAGSMAAEALYSEPCENVISGVVGR